MGNLPIAVLISGRGSNMIALHQAIQRREVHAEIKCAVSSTENAQGLAYAREQGIATSWLENEILHSADLFAKALLEMFLKYHIQLVVLAGFLRKIPDRVVAAYSNKIINIHPALLPAFGGKGMFGRHVHAAVLEYGCKVSGATVHLVSSDYDTGPPILQECVPVFDDDTPETLAARILPIEHKLLPKAVELFAGNKIEIIGRFVRIKQQM